MFPELFGPDRDADPPPEDAIATRKGESNPGSRAALLDDVPFSVKQKLKPKPTVPAQQPPYGYIWSGGCLVKKTSRSRPAVDHLEWKGMNKQQRANAIEEHAGKLREKNEVQYLEALKAAPAMPVRNIIGEEHRERMKTLYNKKLHQIVDEMYALVAKVLSPKEIAASPEAQAAMDKEWKKLVDKGCWVEKKVREFESVASEAKKSNQKVHFGNVFEIGSLKGAELKQGFKATRFLMRTLIMLSSRRCLVAQLQWRLERYWTSLAPNLATCFNRLTQSKHTPRPCSREWRHGYGCPATDGLRNGRG